MTRLLSRRGPDDEGFLVTAGGALGLGHRRLAVFDKSDDARQPMGRDGKWMVFNGEIYNFLEIRRELTARGYAFSTDGDTEVLLRAYQEWGLKGFLKLNGFWAAAIWDEAERELLLVRDRFGVKPLWIASAGNLVAFASERKAFIPLDEIYAGLTRTDYGHVWQNVESLLPGHALRITPFRLETVRWWSTREHIPQRTFRGYGRTVECYRELLLDACRIRLRSDVPVASSVSGGVDSSAVLCAVGYLNRRGTVERRPEDWRRAYYMDWPGTVQDESSSARSAALTSGARLQTVDCFAEPMTAENLTDLIGTVEGPHVNLIAPWLLYRRLQRDGVVVTLDGQGGDETSGGYVQYVLTRALENEGFFRCPLETFKLAYLLHNLHARDDEVWRHVPVPIAAMLASPLGRRMLRVHPVGHRLLGAAHAPGQRAPQQWLKDDVDGLDSLTRVQYVDIHAGVLQHILHYFDLLSMAHGVEIRMPFLDWRLITYALSLPPEFRVGRGWTKRILRDAAAAFTPTNVCYRRLKLSFFTPLSDLLERNRELTEWSLDHAGSDIADPRLRLYLAAQRWFREQWVNWVRARVTPVDVHTARITRPQSGP